MSDAARQRITRGFGTANLNTAQAMGVYGPTCRVEYTQGAGVASSGTPVLGDEITLYVRQVKDPQPGVNGPVFVAPSKWIGTGTSDILYDADTKPGGLAKARVVRFADAGVAFVVTSVDVSVPGVVTCDLEVTA